MKRSKHSLSHYKLLTCDMGELVPIGLTEVLPGDTLQHATSALVRCSPMLAPVMHPTHMRIHHWFVPHRLVWDDWEKFITGGPDGNDASVFPTISLNTTTTAGEGTLADYLGVPSDMGTSLEVSALPFRAYALIYNQFYRDQDLVSELTIDTTSGADTTTNITLQKAAWEKDYFTVSRPWEQKGTGVTIPLGTVAPVRGKDQDTRIHTEADATERILQGTSGSTAIQQSGAAFGATSHLRFNTDSAKVGLEADLTNATAATINDLRVSFALQKYMENRARYGSRFTEYLAYLGIKSSDARLQRPEYLGGGKQTIQFSEVLQTGVDAADEGVGSLYGHGIGALRSNRYRRFFEEHGYVISLMSVLPKTIYAQGLPRTWNRRSKEDFWQAELQHIGQQEVLNKEIKANHATPNGTFGYIDRYDEYRRMESSISGEFRSTLDYWHMARIFAADPALNSTFVNASPTKEIFASNSTDSLLIMANHSIQARRLVAKLGTPMGV